MGAEADPNGGKVCAGRAWDQEEVRESVKSERARPRGGWGGWIWASQLGSVGMVGEGVQKQHVHENVWDKVGAKLV